MISVKGSLKANQTPGLFVKDKNNVMVHKFANYNICDELTIDGRWYDICDIDDEGIWIADQDGEVYEFTPGTEDSHISTKRSN